MFENPLPLPPAIRDLMGLKNLLAALKIGAAHVPPTNVCTATGAGGDKPCKASSIYDVRQSVSTAIYPVCCKVIKMTIWGLPPAGGPLLMPKQTFATFGSNCHKVTKPCNRLDE